MERLVIAASALLFVPGDRPDRVRKARARGVPSLVIDLEDAVPAAQKPSARIATATVLAEPAPGVMQLVRVNPMSESAELGADLAALGEALALADAVILPKVISAAEVCAFDAEVTAIVGRRLPVVATIENAVGVRAAWEIAAASPSVQTLLFGVVDLCADLGITATAGGSELLLARSTVVLACAAAGIGQPLDGPWLNISDTTGLVESARHARSLGFIGKVVIHPDQVAPVLQAFAPSAAEVEWATRVLSAYDEALGRGIGVVRMDDGTFIDVPVAEQARTILKAAAPTTTGAPA